MAANTEESTMTTESMSEPDNREQATAQPKPQATPPTPEQQEILRKTFSNRMEDFEGDPLSFIPVLLSEKHLPD